jgi:YD repeat-containing protein
MTDKPRSMKPFSLLALIPVLFLVSCWEPEVTPPPIQQQQPPLKALRMSEPGTIRELVYDNNGRLTSFVAINEIAGGGEWRSTTELVYDANGRLTESTTDTGWRLVYFYSDGKIVATDEYVTGVLSQQHSHTYDSKGRLIKSITTQNIPEEGGIIPVARDEYQYDDNDNLIVNELYYYGTRGTQSALLTRFVFSNYDDKVSSDDFFDFVAFNPLVSLRKNNPGRLEVTNVHGVHTITEVYTYEYHSRGYATKKTTHTTTHTGYEGEYSVDYEFEE